MAEFLIRAQASSNPKSSEYGDIIIVKPDGHTWGSGEVLPEYIVVKVPGITYTEVRHLTACLIDNTDDTRPVIVKRRKWHVPTAYMDQVVADGNSVITITVPAKKTAFINNMLEKTL